MIYAVVYDFVLKIGSLNVVLLASDISDNDDYSDYGDDDGDADQGWTGKFYFKVAGRGKAKIPRSGE